MKKIIKPTTLNERRLAARIKELDAYIDKTKSSYDELLVTNKRLGKELETSRALCEGKSEIIERQSREIDELRAERFNLSIKLDYLVTSIGNCLGVDLSNQGGIDTKLGLVIGTAIEGLKEYARYKNGAGAAQEQVYIRPEPRNPQCSDPWNKGIGQDMPPGYSPQASGPAQLRSRWQ